MRYAVILAAMVAISGPSILDAVPVAAQGNPGGGGGQGAPGGPAGGVGSPPGPGGLPGGGNPAAVMFQTLDKNRDGVVAKQEFLAPHEQRFDEMDANKDGRLAPEEFNPLAAPPPGSGVPLQQRR